MPTSYATTATAAPAGLSPGELGEVLQLVTLRTGVDLAGQRPAMLARRTACQMAACGARGASEYVRLLRSDPGEPWRLLERLTIKVSRLFRDPATFAAIEARVLPALRASGRGPLRLWSAGCACGEEAYGLAMLCADAVPAWSVLGTDVDRSALARARAATYPAAHAERVPAGLAARHLAPRAGGAVAIRPELARHVRFEAHDLASGSPPSAPRFDLIACRNVLIYYLAERQAKILSTLLGCLAPGGYLVLGEAEWPLPAIAERLQIVDRACRIFRLAGSGEGWA